jgi:hypothetical protein
MKVGFVSKIENGTEEKTLWNSVWHPKTALRKMTSTVLLKHWKNDGIGVFVPKEIILKEMAAKIE